MPRQHYGAPPPPTGDTDITGLCLRYWTDDVGWCQSGCESGEPIIQSTPKVYGVETVYVAAVIATIITATLVGDDASENGVEVFNANDAMQYITFLTVGLMVARGLAKAGNRARNNHA